MKSKIGVISLVVVTVLFLIFGLNFAINYKKEASNSFYSRGYLINNSSNDTSNVEKVYFEADTVYTKQSDDKYNFKNSDGQKVTVSEESFLHYENESIMALKDGVAIDLNNIDTNFLTYYNIFKGATIYKKTTGYEVNNLNDIVSFNKLMFKLSGSKYLIAADNIKVYSSDNQTFSMNKYIEVEYVNENVIRIYNDENNYQTIASNLYVLIDDVKIDLEYKTISKNNVEYLTMADMVINSNDNIEILPEKEHSETPTKQDDSNNTTVPNNDNNDNSTIQSDVLDNLQNIVLPNPNEQIDNEVTFIQPKFSVESMEVTTLGFKNFRVSVIDESAVIYGNLTVQVIKNSTGKVVQTFDEWQEGILNYSINSFNTLEPNTEYTINIIGQYKVDGVIYDRTFVSKMFRTLDIGLEVSTDYVTDSEVNFIVKRIKKSDDLCVNAFDYKIVDSDNQATEAVEMNFNSNDEIAIKASGLRANKEYKLQIENIQYGQDIHSIGASRKFKTLKNLKMNDVNLSYEVSYLNEKLTLSLSGINDLNNGIKSYTYKIYKATNGTDDGELVYSVVKDAYSNLEVDFSNLEDKNLIYYFVVQIAFDDNEKTIIYTTQQSNAISLKEISYPKVINYTSADGDVNCEKLIGVVNLTDKEKFIVNNNIKDYRIVLKEKSTSILSPYQQGYESTRDVRGIEFGDVSEVFLPVSFSNLRPSTDYIMYIYLKTDTGFIYIGYQPVTTTAPTPLSFKKGETGVSNGNLFNFSLELDNTKSNESIDNVNSIRFDLYGCNLGSNNKEVCTNLASTEPPKNYKIIPASSSDTEELDSIKNGDSVTINSASFNFYPIDYNPDYTNYKIKVIAYADGYQIDTNVDGNGPMFTVNIVPSLNVIPTKITKDDCNSNDNCDYNDFGENINDETTVGFNIKADPINTTSKIETFNYLLYTKSGTDCETIPNGVNITSMNMEPFATLNLMLDGEKLKRGETYCVMYYGGYKVNGEDKQTANGYFELTADKQPYEIDGYISSYDGENISFKLNIKDPDKTISNIKFGDDDPDVNDGIYTFDATSGNTGLFVSTDMGEVTNIYTAKLDEILDLPNVPHLVVDSSEIGKIILKVPYFDETTEINKNITYESNGIAGLKINDKYLDLTKTLSGGYEAQISLTKLEFYGLEPYYNAADNKYYIDFDETSINLIYDNGTIVESNGFYFAKKADDYTSIENSYYWGKINNKEIFDKISTTSIQRNLLFTRNLYIQGDEFSTIGLFLNDTIVQLNGIGETPVKTFNIDGSPSSKFEIKKTISTDEINTVYNTLGASISFNITSDMADAVLKLNICSEDNTECDTQFIGRELVSNSIIKSTSISGEKKVVVNFELDPNKEYKYSILYQYGDNPAEVTYNEQNKNRNEDMPVSTFRNLECTTLNVYNENKNRWIFDSPNDPRKVNYSKYMDYTLNVDTTKYSLNDGETIKYDLMIGDNVYIEGKILSSEINNGISENIGSIDLNGQAKGATYGVKIKPYVESSNEKIWLDEIQLNDIVLSNNPTEIAMQNAMDPYFLIAINDKSGNLTSKGDCSIDENGTTNLSCMLLQNKVTENVPKVDITSSLNGAYINAKENTDNPKNVVYFELYTTEGNQILYSPIAFSNKTAALNLYNFFETHNYKDGSYTAKIAYWENGTFHTFTKEVTINVSGRLKVKLITLPNSYVIVMENPDIEAKESINRIRYQYKNAITNKYITNTIEGTEQIKYELGGTETNPTYYLGLSKEGSDVVIPMFESEFIINFYHVENGIEELVETYSK